MECTNRLEDESDNFRVAFDWATKGDVEGGLYLSSRLHNFRVNFDFCESARWLVEFLQRLESSAYPIARAKALYAYGDILILTQQFDLARASVEEGLAFDRLNGNKHGEVDGLILLALIMANLGDFEKEQELRRQALRLARSLADQWRTALSLAWLGLTNRNYQRDRGYLQESIDMFRSMGDLNNLTRFLGHLGRNEMLNGDFESAQVRLEEAISLIREMNRKSISFNVWRAYGQMALLQGNYGRAYTAMQEALQYADKTGERMAVLWFSADLGYVTLKQGNTIETRGLFTKCLKEFLKDEVEIGIVFTIEGMTGLYIILDKPERAARLIGWADWMRKKLDDIRPPLEQSTIDQNIAACLVKMGEVAFSDAYEEGQKMMLHEAIAYALEEN
jgi:tetratricopeptide (TPR) repeat protein